MSPQADSPSSPAAPLIDVDVRDGVAVVTMRRPRQHNAMTVAMTEQLIRIVEESAEDPSVRAIVLSGEGKSFCAGQDVKEPREPSTSARVSAQQSLRRNVASVISDCPLPTFAALHGNVMGRGADIALAADFRIAEPDTVISYPEIVHGMVLAGAGIERLVRCVGESRAMFMLSFGRTVDAVTAADWGLVNWVAQDKSAEQECLDLAAELVTYSENVQLGIKTSVRKASKAMSVAEARADAIANALRRQ